MWEPTDEPSMTKKELKIEIKGPYLNMLLTIFVQVFKLFV